MKIRVGSFTLREGNYEIEDGKLNNYDDTKIQKKYNLAGHTKIHGLICSSSFFT